MRETGYRGGMMGGEGNLQNSGQTRNKIFSHHPLVLYTLAYGFLQIFSVCRMKIMSHVEIKGT